MIKEIISGKLTTRIFATRDAMGKAAAADAARKIKLLQDEKGIINVMFAAAPSQNETLKYLLEHERVDWSNVRGFHMDEYIGLPEKSEKSFASYLDKAVFSKITLKEVFYIGSGNDSAGLIKRYEKLLKDYPIDLVFMGIGENGHIAFNDPHVADFKDKKLVKVVDLDEACRVQQVNDKCFDTLDSVPKNAVTVTIPAITSAKHLICTVPAQTKAQAVWRTLNAPMDENCPSTIMRKHDNAVMYTEINSAKHLFFKRGVITDEISQDFETACELAQRYSLDSIELRSVYETPPEKLNAEQVKKIKGLLKKYNLQVVAISSSIFKCDWGVGEDEKLEKTIAIAKTFGCKFIRAFSFWKSDKYSDEAFAKCLNKLAQRIEKEGLSVVLENDPAVNLTNGASLARALKVANCKNAGVVWDAGNNIYDPFLENPYPAGYQAVKPFITHIHLKDAVSVDGKPKGVAFGTGEVDWVGQLKALYQDGYDGHIMMETHYKLNNKVIDEELLKRPMGSAFSEGGYEATEECLINMEKLIVDTLNSIYNKK